SPHQSRRVRRHEVFRSRSFKGTGFRRGGRRRRGGLLDAGNQIRARGGGILPFVFGDLQRNGNRQAREAAVLVNPARIIECVGFSSAQFGQRLGARGGAVGVNRRRVRRMFHRQDERGENETEHDEPHRRGGGAILRGVVHFLIHRRPPVVCVPIISASAIPMASSRRGSCFGNGACALKSFRKTRPSNPPMNARQPNCSRIQCHGKPSGCATGRMLNDKSTKCISHAHKQTGSMILKLDLTRMGSRTKNGTRKWPKMMTMLTHHHEPRSRWMYQKVSSGRFPFQTTKYCAKWT